jgi:blocked early in transport 1
LTLGYRFGRDSSRNDLFSSYNRSTSPSKTKGKGKSPYGASPGYGYTPPSSTDHLGASFGAYPGANGTPTGSGSGRGSADPTFRSATPNSRGQYSAAVLDELESQNEEQVSVLTGKVKMLKDVSRLSLIRSGFCAARGGLGSNVDSTDS